MDVIPVVTPRGVAELHVDRVPGRRPTRRVLVLGSGAGGGIEALDLVAARDAAVRAGWDVVRVQQPWRVAGRRVAAPPAHLDEAWLTALAEIPPALGGRLVALVLGGRSAGARVACRTASPAGHAVRGVLCLAFPLRPPARPQRSRLEELRQPSVPRLVVQGSRDAFGVPDPEPGIEVHVVDGADHAFGVRRRDGRTPAEVLAEVAAVTGDFLQTLT